MKSLCFTVLILSGINLGFAQKTHPCSGVKSHQNTHEKSATLTVAQIAQTQKYDVNYYKLDLNVERTSTDISGTVTMQASVIEATLDSVLFELYPSLNITEIRLNGTPTAFTRNNTAVTVPVNLASGNQFSIETDYGGTPPTQQTNPLGGSGITNDSSPSWGNQVTWTLSESFVAYEWFPCKQYLRDKIDSVDIYITTDTSNLAGSNGVLKQIVDLGNGKHRFEWESRYPIDYYLISVAVADYIDYSYYAFPSNLPNDSILIQNYIYDAPGYLQYFQSDILQTGDFIEYFSEIYGLYPFWEEKYGHCIAPLSGGMEHQTMTTQGYFERSLTVHEMGHQWFGDMVTCASWADIWVNEGFASYTEYLMYEHFYPGLADGDMQNRHDNVLSAPDGSVWCEDSLNSGRIFDGRLTYDKGGAIIHTLRSIVNDDTLFFQGFRDYLNTHQFSSATGLDFEQSMETTTGMNLSNFFQEWYFGEGYPTYSATWNQIGNQLIVNLTQTASMPTVTPLFTTPVEIKIARVIGDTVFRMNVNAASESIQIPVGGNVGAIIIDPNNFIINKVGSVVKDESLGLTDYIASSEDVKIYPNPTDGPINIEMPHIGNYDITIINAAGKVVQKTSLKNSAFGSFNLETAGYYMIQVKEKSGDFIRRKVVRF